MSNEVIVKRIEPRPSVVFDTYWRFAAERQAVYFRRLRGEAVQVMTCDACGPSLSLVDGYGRCTHRVQVLALTADPVLSEYRFTNCYRASDRVSQHLLRNVVYVGDQSPQEVIFRTLLFKIFNKVSTWETLVRGLGHVPRWSNGCEEDQCAGVLDRAKAAGEKIYSAAYVMPSPGNAAVKHRAHMQLIKEVMAMWPKLVEAASLDNLYKILLLVPSFGPFLAFQLAIDLNYGPSFDHDEDDHVVAGPGALDGISKCFSNTGEYAAEDVIRWTVDRQEQEFSRLGLTFETLFGRRLHLIDAQNLYCEISKYARVAHPEVVGVSGRSRIKQRYVADSSPLPRPFFPPKWELSVDGEETAQAILSICFRSPR